MRKSALILAMALPLATLAPLTPPPAQAGLKLDIVIDGVSVREVRSWRADDPLRRRELRWRLDRLRKMAAFPLLKKKDRRHVNALIAAYERRLATPPVSPDEQQARMLLEHWNGQDLRRAPQRRLEHVAGRIDALLARPGLRPRTRQQLARLGERVRAELDARASGLDMARQREAERLLNRHINLRALPTDRLRALGMRVTRLLEGPGLLRRTRQDLAALRDRIQVEMRRRTSTPAVSQDERMARNLLARHEGRNLRRLPTQRLRRVKARIADLKRSPDLQRRTRQRLVKLERRVTAELRRRQGDVRPPLSGAEREARQLLAEARDLRPMTDAALRSVRWEAISLLSSPGLSPRTRQQLIALSCGSVCGPYARRCACPACRRISPGGCAPCFASIVTNCASGSPARKTRRGRIVSVPTWMRCWPTGARRATWIAASWNAASALCAPPAGRQRARAGRHRTFRGSARGRRRGHT